MISILRGGGPVDAEQAPHVAIWWHKLKQRLLILLDQSSKFTRMEWAAFRAIILEHSMGRRGNRHDHAVAESFSSLKQKRIRRRIYKTREETRQNEYNYTEF
ncbi:hypothetical protein [Sphingobium sp. HWE2-09]|uniref:hypothetical protein n=1 Tax=Sphingobium sp. HWE2-09 TaxID=3108390 RepID=UPI002DC9DFF5|nr:hypothetical protein [Sphingobium sp. HWE2-09]